MRRFVVPFLIAQIVLLAQPALGELITIEVTGVVDSIALTGDLALDGSIGIGSSIRGECTYDLDAHDYDSSEQQGSYWPDSLLMAIGNYAFTHVESVLPPYFKVWTDNLAYEVYSTTSVFEGLIVVNGESKAFSDISWFDWEEYSLTLIDLASSISDHGQGDALPTPTLLSDLSIFDMRRDFSLSFQLPSSGFEISGHIDSIISIPEPATLLLFGLGGLFLRKRK